MAPPHPQTQKPEPESSATSNHIAIPARSQLDEIRDELQDESASGSEHAATPPIQIGSGPPARQSTPGETFRNDDVVRKLLQNRDEDDDDILSVASALSTDQPLRARGSSISFDPKVMSDAGDQLPLQIKPSTEKSSLSGKRSLSPAGTDGCATITGMDRKSGRDMHYDKSNLSGPSTPLAPSTGASHATSHPARTDVVRKILMGTDTGLSVDSDYQDPTKMASLTSATTTPSLDEIRTPLEPVSEYFASPTSLASPHTFPSLDTKDMLGRRESQRSSRNRSQGARRVSRRSSARSTGISPASSFLSGFGRSSAIDDPTIALQDPDADGKEFGDDVKYVIGEEIGRGGFSVIKEVHTYEGDVLVVRAVKIVRKRREGQSEIENDKVNSDFDREVDVWRYLHHPFVLPLIAVYDTDFAMFCVMMYVKGGSLFDMLRAQRRRGRMNTSSSAVSLQSDQPGSDGEAIEPSRRGLSPALARRYIYQIASALRYLHEDVRVVHRDVKLENCLLDMTAPNAQKEGGNILLCDFGLADYINNEGRASPEPFDPDEAAGVMSSSMSITVAGGSLQYAAPELIGRRHQLYSTAVDIWAFGVCAYTLITGEMPFTHTLQAKIVEAIQKCEYDVDRIRSSPAALEASEEAVEFIRKCLEPNPDLRWTIDDVLESRFLKGCKELYERDPDSRSTWP